jgi:hypothetical protein
MGIGPARTLILPGWHHVAAETFYDGRWHYLDLDVRAAFRRPDGSLASMAEAQRDDTLWKGPQGPLFFPLDPLGSTRSVYQRTAVEHYYGYSSGGHTMDYVLRQGETFTRWWTPQGGRWLNLPDYQRDPFFRRLFERAPRGPKCKHDGWTIHTHGNGRFVYRPDLSERSSDFEDGAYDAANVRPAAGGLTLVRPGTGYAVFEVRSPYVIVPRVGDMTTTADDCEASVVRLEGSGLSAAISQDNGLTWKAIRLDRGSADLTADVSGTYGYLLKVTLDGEPGRAVLRSLTLKTWVQVAPASLPALRRGENRMVYRTGDHYDLPSRVVEIHTNGSDRPDFLKYLVQTPPDFDPNRKTERAKGPFVVKVAAPPHSRIAWFSAGGNFNTNTLAGARQTRNTMAYALEPGGDFREFYRADVPADQGHWHTNADREVRLDRPARTVYLRYVGNPGVNNLRIYAHCVDDRPHSGAPVTLTHVWTERGARKSRSVTQAPPGSYEVTTADEPVNVSVEIAVPSDRK